MGKCRQEFILCMIRSLGIGPRFSWPELSFALMFVCLGLAWMKRQFTLGEDMPVGDPFLKEGLEFRL